MDDGLRKAIAIAAPGAMIEESIDVVRRFHDIARRLRIIDPAMGKQYLKIARSAGRIAVRSLPGGELRELLLGGELISEEDWERLAGPPLPTPLLQPLSAPLVELSAPVVNLSSPASTTPRPRRKSGPRRKTKKRSS